MSESMSGFDRWWEEEAAVHVELTSAGRSTEFGNTPK